MHLLPGLRRARPAQCLPELRWRFFAAARAPSTNWKGDNFLGKYPAGQTPKHRPVDAAAHRTFAAPIRSIAPERR
jgi:hypothetical protein